MQNFASSTAFDSISTPPEVRTWTDPQALCLQLGLDPASLDFDLTPSFPCRIPTSYAQRMRPGDPSDPLLLQVLPRQVENNVHPGYGPDPLAEVEREIAPGILQVHPDRLLVLVHDQCAIHCRHCFRRTREHGITANTETLVKIINKKTGIQEIILSGGEPLLLPVQHLNEIISILSRFSHIERLRIHTRLPIADPDRITPQLLETLQLWPRRLTIVLHTNHAQELDASVENTCKAMQNLGIYLESQGVLLKGINDSIPALTALFQRLATLGIRAKYMHSLDKVQGAAHFAVSNKDACALRDALSNILPNEQIPRFVRDPGGMEGKCVITPDCA